MTKDIKYTVLLTISSILIFLLALTKIYQLEYPAIFLIHSITKEKKSYLVGDNTNLIKITSQIEENINRTLTLSTESILMGQTILIHAKLIFNPLGQLFNGKIALTADNSLRIECTLTGTKLITATCDDPSKTNVETLHFDGPVLIKIKPDLKYSILNIHVETHPVTAAIKSLLEHLNKLHEEAPTSKTLNLDLSNYPILKESINRLLNDFTTKNK